MLEMIVFAITLVVAQVVAGFIVLKVVMSKWYINKVVKMSTDMMSTFAELELNSKDEDL